MDRRWHELHPDYDRGRRWQGSSNQARKPSVLAGVPWDLAQEEFGAKGVVVIAGVVRVALRQAQDEMWRHLQGISEKTGGLRPVDAQDEMAARPP